VLTNNKILSAVLFIFKLSKVGEGCGITRGCQQQKHVVHMISVSHHKEQINDTSKLRVGTRLCSIVYQYSLLIFINRICCMYLIFQKTVSVKKRKFLCLYSWQETWHWKYLQEQYSLLLCWSKNLWAHCFCSFVPLFFC